MTKRCICQICTCGRHKCPHNPRGLSNGPQQCAFSEYTSKYPAHPMEGMRKSFKPDQKPVAGDGVMEDKTTHKVDYIEHPLGQHYIHQGDKYRPPEGEMDMLTNYHREFTKKPLEPVKAIRKDDQRKVPGKFEGLPTYTSDYREWAAQPRDRVGPDNTYRPPSAAFAGNSNYTTDYIPHQQAMRQSMRPQEAAKGSDQPFDDMTDYKQSYIKYQVQPREQREKTVWQPNTAKLDDLSNYRKDYTEKGAGKQASCKPDATPFQSQAPFDAGTTQKADYIEWPTGPRFVREQDRYQKPDGEMEKNTTSHTDYNRKPIERQLPRRPQEIKKLPGKFDGVTNYQVEYRKWAMGDRPQQTMKDQYTPNDAPFEGMPTYQRDYIQHQAAMTRSMKPADLGYSSGAPLDDGTEYKKEFTKKFVAPCPVPLVESGGHASYTYREQDDVGHKWYDMQQNGVPIHA